MSKFKPKNYLVSVHLIKFSKNIKRMEIKKMLKLKYKVK